MICRFFGRAWVGGIVLFTAVSPALASDPTVEDQTVRPIIQTNTDAFLSLHDLIEARDAFARGDFGSSLALYRSVFTNDSSVFEARLGYADSLLALGKWDMAGPVLSVSDAEGATNDQLRRMEASRILHTAMAQQDAQSRLALLRVAAEAHSDDLRLWNMLAKSLDAAGLHTEAEATYLALLKTYPEHAASHCNYGIFLLKGNRPGRALTHLETAYRLSPNRPSIESNYRLGLMATGAVGQAMNGASDDMSAKVLNDAAVLELRRGNTARAKTYLEKAVQLSPTYFHEAQNNLTALVR